MGPITTKIPNASELIRRARDWVAGKSRREALLALATVVRVTDFERETKTARDLMARYPLQGLFGGVTVDESARVVGRTRSAFTTDEKEFELALWERVVRGVDLGYQVESQTGIVPAMNQLNFEHSLGLEDMVDLVVHKPVRPSGARGALRERVSRGVSVGSRRKSVDSRSATREFASSPACRSWE